MCYEMGNSISYSSWGWLHSFEGCEHIVPSTISVSPDHCPYCTASECDTTSTVNDVQGGSGIIPDFSGSTGGDAIQGATEMSGSMTRDELLQLHRDTSDKCREIMEMKNKDYSGGGDTFANFKAGEVLGIPAEIGILLRCLDKLQRIKAFVNTGTLAVKSESVDDAIEDVINYMVLLKGIIKEKNES